MTVRTVEMHLWEIYGQKEYQRFRDILEQRGLHINCFVN